MSELFPQESFAGTDLDEDFSSVSTKLLTWGLPTVPFILSRPSTHVTYKVGNSYWKLDLFRLQAQQIAITWNYLFKIFELALTIEFLRGRLWVELLNCNSSGTDPNWYSIRNSRCDSELTQQQKDRKGNTLPQVLFFRLCVTVDMCLNKPVTKEFPYLLLREHRIAERRLVQPLAQKCIFLVPY
jgi:hypothetical protein